jgi:hypothetical protein
MKGKIQADHMPINNYELIVVGLPPLTVVEVSGIEDVLNTTELPDKTVASTGTRQASEVELTMPMHHLVEQAAMEVWFRESQDPVSPSYKKAATLIHKSVTGKKLRTFSLIGMFPTSRALPDLKMDDEGEMAVVVWKMSIDDQEPI